MATKSYTDIPQSETLSKILSPESADMYYPNRTDIQYQGALPIGMKHGNPLLSQEIPCWSLAALLKLMPKIGAHEPMLRKLYYISEPTERYICQYSLTDMTSEYDNPVDACHEMIIKLHGLNLL